jgi:hypothetical protein
MKSLRSDAQLAARLGRDIVTGVFPDRSLMRSAAEMGALDTVLPLLGRSHPRQGKDEGETVRQSDDVPARCL